jgi:hypothetical protein
VTSVIVSQRRYQAEVALRVSELIGLVASIVPHLVSSAIPVHEATAKLPARTSPLDYLQPISHSRRTDRSFIIAQNEPQIRSWRHWVVSDCCWSLYVVITSEAPIWPRAALPVPDEMELHAPFAQLADWSLVQICSSPAAVRPSMSVPSSSPYLPTPGQVSASPCVSVSPSWEQHGSFDPLYTYRLLKSQTR